MYFACDISPGGGMHDRLGNQSHLELVRCIEIARGAVAQLHQQALQGTPQHRLRAHH